MFAEAADEVLLTEASMAVTHRSKRFNPTVVTEKLVPILLVMLILILISVFVVIGLSLAGVIQPA